MFERDVEMRVFVYRADGSLYDTFVITTSYPVFSAGWMKAVEEDGNYIGGMEAIVEFEYEGRGYMFSRRRKNDE